MIPVNEPVIGNLELKYLKDCVDSGWISSEGPYVFQFENQIAQRIGRKHGISVCNGSAALEVAVAALNFMPGDEIIMPTFTIISCAAPIVRAKAKPVLVDSDPLTWNMDVDQVEKKITSRTKAIMAVHIYGLPVNMDPIFRLADKYGLKVIEDAAEMIGQTYKDRPCGSLGDVSILSFYPNKLVTTGEGGMILTDSDAIADRCRSLRNLCFQPGRRFVHKELGWNFRMTNLQAAVGIAQLERLDEFVSRKRAIGSSYTQSLKDIYGFQLPVEKTDYGRNIYWVYGIVLKDDVPFDAAEIMSRLKKHGVGTRPFFWPMHEQPVFKKFGLFRGERYPGAETMARRGFYIPSGLALTGEQIKAVCQALHEVADNGV